jgi:serine/threonine protein kinase
MGEVYRAHDPQLRRDVAIKVMAARFATDPDLLQRFSQEALASAALNHPNIVAVFDVGTHEGTPYLVTITASSRPPHRTANPSWRDRRP